MRYLEFAGTSTEGHEPKKERLAIAIDVSYSMDEDDWKPTRLEAAKEATAALIERKAQIAPNDEIAIVTYAGDATVLCPAVTLSTDMARLYRALGAAKLAGYTSLTAGLQAARTALTSGRRAKLLDRLMAVEPESHQGPVQRIVLLTDGHHNKGRSPKSMATRLKNAGVFIDCVGIGGSPSDVDEALLRTIASRRPDGVTPRYAFIGDKADLIQKFEQLAARISR